MKAKEVIAILNDMKGVFSTRGHEQYSLPALDLAIEALEKQIPKQVIDAIGDYEPDYDCPTCGIRTRFEHQNYCLECGQGLGWD